MVRDAGLHEYGKSRPHRGSNPGPYSPWPVTALRQAMLVRRPEVQKLSLLWKFLLVDRRPLPPCHICYF